MMKKSQKSSHGTAPCSRQTRSQSRMTRPAKTETISRYFKKQDKSEDKINQSIYKDAVTEIGETQPTQHDTSDGDFVMPKPPRKVAKIFAEVKEANKRATRARSSRTKKSAVSKEEEKLIIIGRSSDINMEHLQLAMALSKSIEPELCDAQENAENIFPTTQQIIENTKVALSGFKRPTTKLKDHQNLSKGVNNLTENVKSRKKSKFRHVKPKLYTRTTEDRERLIQEKITLILSYCISPSLQQEEINIHSDVLSNIASENRRCFSLSHQVDKDHDAYYVKGLGVEKSDAVCGCLLKDWGLIAGRDKTPERLVTNVQTNESDDDKIVEAQEVVETNADIGDDTTKEPDVQNELEVNATQSTHSTAKSCSSYISTVSHASRKMIRSASPDLFLSSDEDMADEVFCDTQSQLTTEDLKYSESNSESLVNVECFQDGAGVVSKKTNEDLTAPSDVGCLTSAPRDEVNNVEKKCPVYVLSNITIVRPNNQEIVHEELPENFETEDDNEVEDDKESMQSQSKLSVFYKRLNVNNTSLNDYDQNYEMDDRGICTYESFCDYDEHVSVHSGQSEELLCEVGAADDVTQATESPEKVTNQETDVFIDRAPAQGINDDNDEDEEEINDMENENEDVFTSKLDDSDSTLANSNNSVNNYTITPEFGKSFAPMNVTSHVHALLNSDTFYNEHKSICIEKYFNSPGIAKKTVERTSGDLNLSTEVVRSRKVHEDFPQGLVKDKRIDDYDLDDISENRIDCIDLSAESDHENNEHDTSSQPQNTFRTNSSLQRHVSSKSLDSTASTSDSICISDEELNYSCLNATPRANKDSMTWRFEKLAYKKNMFAISDSEDEGEDVDGGGGNEIEESINVTKLLRALQERKMREIENLSQGNLKENDVIALSDEDNKECSDDDLQEALRLSLVEAENDEKRRLGQNEGNADDCSLGVDDAARAVVEDDEGDEGNVLHHSLFEMTGSKSSGIHDCGNDQQNRDSPRGQKFDDDLVGIQDGANLHYGENRDLPEDMEFDDRFSLSSNNNTNLRKNSRLDQSIKKINPIQDGGELELTQNVDKASAFNQATKANNNIKSNSSKIGDTTIVSISNKNSNNSIEDVEYDAIDLGNEKEKIESVSMNMGTEPNFNYSFPSFDCDNYDHCRPSLTMRQYHSPEAPETCEMARDKSFIPTPSTTTDNEVDEFDLLVNSNISKSKVDKVPRRVQELINENTPKKYFNTSNRLSGTFEDTFANLLEQTNVLKKLKLIETHGIDGNGSNDKLKTPRGNRKLQCAGSDAPNAPATPADGLYIKSDNITPMPKYDVMTTPEIHAELDKIGVKRMKRRRGVLMLKHVYNSMHLQLEKHDISEIATNHQCNVVGNTVENTEVDLDEVSRPHKRRKRLNYASQDGGDVAEVVTIIPQASQAGEIETNSQITESESLEDMIFERKQSKRIKSCALPFHIAWHNFLCVHREIWQNVLLYEPLQVEVLYAMFKDLGFKYHIQDMIAFFDKKCITIRIKQNN